MVLLLRGVLLKHLRGQVLLLVTEWRECRLWLNVKIGWGLPILLICCIRIDILRLLLLLRRRWWRVMGGMLKRLMQVRWRILPIKGGRITHFPEVSSTKASIRGIVLLP